MSNPAITCNHEGMTFNTPVNGMQEGLMCARCGSWLKYDATRHRLVACDMNESDYREANRMAKEDRENA